MSSFNFEQAIKDSLKATSSTALECVVLGPSGSGKSSLLGTFGVKTLYLYTTGEAHGSKAARHLGHDNVVPVSIDREGEKSLAPEDAYARLLTILNDVEGINKAGFKAIGVDGASELETIIRQMPAWKKACLSANGKHNAFSEGPATIELFRPIVVALKNLQLRLDTHFAMTLTLDVKSMGINGEYEEAMPRLKGYAVAEQLLQQFGDVLVVGKMQKNNEIKHKLQAMTEITKVSKDENGSIKKSLNFSPRLSGITMPPYMDANLADVIKLKAKG